MKCTACGAELAEGTKFCTQCGHTVEGASEFDQGAGYGQNAGYQQGAGYGQNAGYQQGAGYGQDAGYQQGAGYDQNANYQQGTGYNYGAGAGYGYNQGAEYNPGVPSGPMTKKEFYKLPGVKSCRTNIRTCAILAYVCSGVTILASLLLSDYLASSILDGLLLLGLGLGLQLARSRVCAIIIAGYGILNMIIGLLANGTIQGWLIPVIGIYAIIYTFKYQKMWDRYIKEGVLP